MSKMRGRKGARAVEAGAILGLCLAAVPAWSQQVAEAQPAEAQPAAAPPKVGVDQLEEVVVTAQKRTEDLQKVPISLQVLTGQDLSLIHI